MPVLIPQCTYNLTEPPHFSDFLYSRENAGDPCIMMEGVSEDWFIPDSCSPGTFYNRSLGYLKIEGDMCTGGEESLFSYRKTKCPDSSEF